MFVEHKEVGEETRVPAKLPRLSEIVREHGYGRWFEYSDCVLGRAYRAWTGGKDLGNDGYLFDRENAPDGLTHTWRATQTFGIPFDIVSETELMCIGRKTPTQIADWLEAKGY